MNTAALALLLLSAVPAQAQENEKWWDRWFGFDPGLAQQIREDEKLLQDAKLATDPQELVGILRHMTPAPGDEKKIDELFQLLDSDKFKERDKATAAIIAFGPKAIPLLKRLVVGAKLEVRMRAERCLTALEARSPAAQAAAAVRLIKARAPAGAVAALLEFAAYAPDELVAEEILDAVYMLGVRQGKLDPALDAALKDPHPARRGIAAVLLGRFGNEMQRKLVLALLEDKDLEVRFRAAQGLVAKGERAALPVLVEMVKLAPYNMAERAEEILVQVAGKTAPPAALGVDQAERKKCHDGWSAWLTVHQAKIDLTKADLGFPLPSPESRARAVARELIDLMLKPKEATAAKITRLTDVPFYQSGAMVIKTREEWQDQIKRDAPMPEGVKYKVKINKIEPLTDYLPKANPMDKEFLNKLPRAEVRVVHVALEIDFMGQQISLTMPLFVRINGARGRIFGFGTPSDITTKMNE